MGMSIEEAIKEIESITVVTDEKQALAFALAVHTMKKYQMIQSGYENRLKADLKAILVELQLEIREHDPGCGWDGYADKNVIDCIIQQKINELKSESEG